MNAQVCGVRPPRRNVRTQCDFIIAIIIIASFLNDYYFRVFSKWKTSTGILLDAYVTLSLVECCLLWSIFGDTKYVMQQLPHRLETVVLRENDKHWCGIWKRKETEIAALCFRAET